MYESSSSSTSTLKLDIISLSNFSHLEIHSDLTINNDDFKCRAFFHIFIDHLNDFFCKMSGQIFFLSLYFQLCLCVLLLSCNFLECKTDTNTLSAIRISNIFFRTGVFLFIFNRVSLKEKKILNLKIFSLKYKTEKRYMIA